MPSSDGKNSHLYGELISSDDIVYFLTNVQEDGFRKFMYFDKTGGECNYLCGKPECTHDSSDCSAVAGFSNTFGIGLYGNRIYWISESYSEGGIYEGLCLYRMNTDGTKRKRVRMINEVSDLEHTITGSVRVLYTDGYVIIAGGRNSISSASAHNYETIRALSVSNEKKDKEVLDLETDGSLYVYTSGSRIFYSLTTQDAQEDGEAWQQNSRLQIYVYDLRNGETNLLFDDEVPFTLWEFRVEENQAFISANSDLQSMNSAYILDLDQKRIVSEIHMEDEITGMISYIDRNRITCYSHPENDPFRYEMLVKDFEGNIVSDTFGVNDMVSASKRGRSRIFAGTDQDYSYCFYRESFGNKEGEWLLAYPSDGGEAKILYASEAEDSNLENTTEGISVRMELPLEKEGNIYYADDFSELKDVSLVCCINNNTDEDLENIRITLTANKRIISEMQEERWPKRREGVESSTPLAALTEADFMDHKTVLLYEGTAELSGNENRTVSFSCEIELRLR